MLKHLRTYAIPVMALILIIGLIFWRIGYLERTNISLSMEIGSTSALQNGEEISLQNPVIWHENEPCVPLNEVVRRLGGRIDGEILTIQQNTVKTVGFVQDNVIYTPVSYLQEKRVMAARWDKERNRVILTVAPDEIPLTRRWLFWRHRTVRGLRVGDSEERFLDLYGSPSARDEMIADLLHVTVENVS